MLRLKLQAVNEIQCQYFCKGICKRARSLNIRFHEDKDVFFTKMSSELHHITIGDLGGSDFKIKY